MALRAEKLLKRLTGQEREIVRLFYLEDRSYEEISTETDVPVNTIGAILSRARKKLREMAKRTSTEVPVLKPPAKKPKPAPNNGSPAPKKDAAKDKPKTE